MAFRGLLLFLLLAFWGAFQTLKGQEPRFRHFSVEDGMSTSETYGIFQDRDGYIWIATEYGVSRFNGYDFQHYSTDDGLSDNTIFDMYQDSRGRIWFHTFNGIPSYYLNGKFVSFAEDHRSEKGNFTTAIVETRDSMVWFSAKQKKIIGITPGDSTFLLPLSTVISSQKYYTHFLTNVEVEGETDDVLISATSVYRYSSQDQSFTKADPDCWFGFSNPHFTVSWKNHFVTSLDHNLLFYRWNGETFSHYQEISVPTLQHITGLHLDSQGNIWVATYAGVYRWDGQRWADHFLKGYSVSDILEDREGGFWFTTLKNGIFYASSLDFQGWDRLTGTQTDRLTSLAFDPVSNGLLIGSADGKLIHKRGNQFTTLRSIASLSNRSVEIGSILPRGTDTLMVGTNSGLFALDREGNQLKNYLPFGSVKSLYQSRSGRQYACLTGGVFPMVPEYEKIYDSLAIVPYEERAVYLNSIEYLCPRVGRTTSMLEDREGNLWFGSLDGLEFRDKRDTTKSLLKVPEVKFSVQSILEDPKEGLWVASHGDGLLHIRPDTTIFITKNNGLGSNLCNKITLDPRGGVWVCSNQGVSRVIPATEPESKYSVQHFSISDGLISSEINDLVVVADTLWMASSEGLGYLPLNWNPRNEFTPPLVEIDSVLVNGKAVSTKGQLILSPGQNNLGIHFTGISFGSMGKIQYGYRLNSEPENWHRTPGREVDFLSLSPGKYHFEVWASDLRGNRSEGVASLNFTIRKPWWQTWWAMGGGLLFAVGLVWWAFQRRFTLLKEKQILQNSAAEADQRALRARITPHFIFNALNSLQALIADGRRVDAMKYTSRFARLMRRIFEQSVENYVPIPEELETLEMYLKIEQIRFADRFSFRLEVDEDEVEHLMMPSMLLQPVVENAIWHGLLHRESTGEITIRVSVEGKKIRCTVEDNGIGREAAKLHQSKYSGKSKSSGLEVTRERIQNLGERFDLNVDFEITDLKDDSGNPLGTRIEITIPLIYNQH